METKSERKNALRCNIKVHSFLDSTFDCITTCGIQTVSSVKCTISSVCNSQKMCRQNKKNYFTKPNSTACLNARSLFAICNIASRSAGKCVRRRYREGCGGTFTELPVKCCCRKRYISLVALEFADTGRLCLCFTVSLL